MSKTQTRSNLPRTVTIDFYLSFERTNDGYTMHTRMAPVAGMTGAPMDDLLSQPIAFRLTTEGEIVGIVDEPGYWAVVDQAIERFLPAEMKADPKGIQLIRTMIQDMRNLPDDQRMALIAKNYQPILDMPGVQLAPGEKIEAEEEANLPFPSLVGGMTLPRKITVTLNGVTKGFATFTYRTFFEPAVMKAALEKLMQLAPPDKRKPVPLANVTQIANYKVSLQTGLTEKYEEVVASDDGNNNARRETSIVLIAN